MSSPILQKPEFIFLRVLIIALCSQLAILLSLTGSEQRDWNKFKCNVEGNYLLVTLQNQHISVYLRLSQEKV